MILPPGTILQHMFLREQLSGRAAGRFVEIGVGAGSLSRELLRMGWQGRAIDINVDAVGAAAARNAAAVADGRYAVQKSNWLDDDARESVDLVISSMVIEHLSDEDEALYWHRTREALTASGSAIVLVPASPRHWGIEDDIAGHIRRYTADGMRARLESLGWSVRTQAGLTYPLSNVLLPLSNLLVRRAESASASLSLAQRTANSGVRDVSMKTRFPRGLGLILNEHTLYPLHILQKATRMSSAALVLYTEAVPR